MKTPSITTLLTLALAGPALAGGIFSSIGSGSYSNLDSGQLRDRLEKERSSRLLENLRKRQVSGKKRAPRKDARSSQQRFAPEPATSSSREAKLEAFYDVRSAAPAPVAFKPKPKPQALEVYGVGARGDRVAIAAADLARVRPPDPPTPPAPGKAPREFSPGAARLDVDLNRQEVSLLWTFERLVEGEGSLHLGLPPSLRGVELDGLPVPVGADGGLRVAGKGEHTLALDYRPTLSRDRGGAFARVWTPPQPLVSLHATLPGRGLSARVPGGLAVQTTEAASATTVSARLTPRRSVELRWERRVAGLPGADVDAGPQEADVTAQAVVSYTVDGEDLRIRAGLRWTVGAPGVNRLAFRYPPGTEVLEILDDGGRAWPHVAVQGEGASRRILLGLPTRRTGEIGAQVRLAARPSELTGLRSGADSRALPLPSLAPEASGRVLEFVSVHNDPRTKGDLVPRKAFQPKDRTELPDWADGLLASGSTNFARRLSPDVPLYLGIEPLRSDPDMFFEIATAEAVTVLAENSRVAWTQVTYAVRNTAEQFLDLALPPGTRLRGATVRGEPIKPGMPEGEDPERPSQVLLALPPGTLGRDGAPVPYSVQVVLEAPLPALGWMGTVDLALCRPGADVARTTWWVWTPRRVRFTHSGGDLRPLTSSFTREFQAARNKLQQFGSRGRAQESRRMISQMSNVAANFAPPPRRPPSGASADLGLLPVQLNLPPTSDMTRLGFEQDAVTRGGSQWSLRLRYTSGSLTRGANLVFSIALGVGLLVCLLWIGGAAPLRLGLGLVAVGLAGYLGLRYSDAARRIDFFEAVVFAVLGAVAYLGATPVRRLHAPAAKAIAALLFVLGSAAHAAGPARVDARLPFADETPKSLAGPNSGHRVLVPGATLDALEAAAKQKDEAKPPEEKPDLLLYGDQRVKGSVQGEVARLELVVPIRVRGKGPWIVPVLKGVAAIESATLTTGRGRPTPLGLVARRDGDLERLEEETLSRFGALLTGQVEGEAPRGPVTYDALVEGASPQAFRDHVLTVKVVTPVVAQEDGSYHLDLEPPAGASRRLELLLPEDVRVSVRGDPAPVATDLHDQVRVRAAPRRDGAVHVSWSPRASHGRPAPPRTQPPPPEVGIPDVVPNVTPNLAPPPSLAPAATTQTPAAPLALADWAVLLDCGEEAVEGVARLRLEVPRGSVERVLLQAPPEVVITAATGPRLTGSPRKLAGASGPARYALAFPARVQGTIPIDVRFRIPLKKEDAQARRATFQAPLFRLEGSEEERGRIGVRRQGSREVAVLSSAGVEPDPLAEGEVLAFRWEAESFQLELAVDSPAPIPVWPAAIVAAQARTQLGKGKVREVELTLDVLTNGKKFLTLGLPEGAVSSSIHLYQEHHGARQRLSKVYDQSGRLQVSLPQPPPNSSAPVRTRIALDYRREVEALEGWMGEVQLELPSPDLPITQDGLAWTLHLNGGNVWSRIDPGDSREPPRPYAATHTLSLSGYLPGEGGEAQAIQLRAAWFDEDLLLALYALVFLLAGAAGLAVPNILAGRHDLGLLPRVAVLAALGAGAVLLAETPLPADPETIEAGLALGVLLGVVYLWRGRRRSAGVAAVAALALSLPAGASAAPRGIDLKYQTAAEAAAALARGRWRAIPLRELTRLERQAHDPRPGPEQPTPPVRKPAIRTATHAARVEGKSVEVTSVYEVQGFEAGAWTLSLDLGPEAALDSVVRLSGGRAGEVTVVPAGGPGTPGQGPPQPGRYEVHGLSGRQLIRLQTVARLPVIREGETGLFQVSTPRAAAARFEVRLPEERSVDAEVFPSVDVSVEASEEGVRLVGDLLPTSSFAVRWTTRGRSRRRRPTEDAARPEEALRFQADAWPSYRLDGERLHGSHRVRLTVSSGALDRVRLQLPGDEEVLRVDGADVASFQHGPGGAEARPLDVLLRTRKRGTLELRVQTLRTLAPEVAQADRMVRRLQLTGASVEGAERQAGYLRLDVPSSTTAQPSRVLGASRADPREVRPRAPEGALVFRYLAPGFSVDLDLERFPHPAVRELVGQEGTVTVIPLARDLASYQCQYTVENRGYQSLRLRLPEGARLVSAEVGGNPVKPGSAPDGELRIPLRSGAGGGPGATFPIRIVYVGPAPQGAVTPPALLDTALASLSVVLHHEADESLRVAGGPYLSARRAADFFEPLQKAARSFPSLVAWLLFQAGGWLLVIAVLWGGFKLFRAAPCGLLVGLGALSLVAVAALTTAGSEVDRLLGTVDSTLSVVQDHGGFAPPMPAPSSPGAGGRAFRQAAKAGAFEPAAEEAEGLAMDADGFGDDEDFGMMNAPVAQAMLGSVDKNAQNELLAQLSGEDSSAGSLPVPIEFRTRDLVRSTFRTALVPAGGAPELRVEALGRPARRAWVLLAALAAMAGALLLVRGTAGTLVPVGVLAVGLVAGFALNASFGGGGEPVWVGVVLGGLLGLRRPPTATMEEDSA